MARRALYPSFRKKLIKVIICSSFYPLLWPKAVNGLPAHSAKGKTRRCNQTAHPAESRIRKAQAMLAFLKSELFLRFAGGFAIGLVGMVLLQPDEQPILSTSAIAATGSSSAAL